MTIFGVVLTIDKTNSKEMIAGSHIMEFYTHECEEPVPPELLNVVPDKPQAYDLFQNYQLDFSNKSKDSNILSKTNNVTHKEGIDLLSQKNSGPLLKSTWSTIHCL